jgi:hypothetical protein
MSWLAFNFSSSIETIRRFKGCGLSLNNNTRRELNPAFSDADDVVDEE